MGFIDKVINYLYDWMKPATRARILVFPVPTNATRIKILSKQNNRVGFLVYGDIVLGGASVPAYLLLTEQPDEALNYPSLPIGAEDVYEMNRTIDYRGDVWLQFGGGGMSGTVYVTIFERE